jgi:hypothetical protein
MAPKVRIDEIKKTTDDFCELVMSGKMMTEIADIWGVSKSALIKWLSSDEDRAARAREARSVAGHSWDGMAVRELESLPADATPGQIARARELASHYRWRATKISPPYADKTHSTVEATVKHAKPVSDEEALAEIAELSQQLGGRYQLVEVVDEDETDIE